MRVASVRLTHENAGLSPMDNNRVEVFLAGCGTARCGFPCQGCFNKDLWYPDVFPEVSVEELFQDIAAYENKYVTIVGGEPLDQAKELAGLTSRLQAEGFHIVLFTHYGMSQVLVNESWARASNACNVVIDGKYRPDKRIYGISKVPGIHHVVGSSNQVLWHRTGKSWHEVPKNSRKKVREAFFC